MGICEFFVVAEQIADFAASHTNITRWYISLRTHMSEKLRHEGLAKTHDFSIRQTLRIEICTTFATTHRKACQAVFENLFESEKFENALID